MTMRRTPAAAEADARAALAPGPALFAPRGRPGRAPDAGALCHRLRWPLLLAAGFLLALRAYGTQGRPAPATLAACPSASAERCRALDRGDAPVVHWHIMKTGGTTMCIQAVMNAERTYTLKDHPSYLAGRCAEDRWVPGGVLGCHEHCHPVASRRAAVDSGTLDVQRAAYAATFEAAGENLTYISPGTHLSQHGIIHAYPGADGRERAVFHTVGLREPEARMVSLYHQEVTKHTGAEGAALFLQWFGSPEPPTLQKYLEATVRDTMDDNFQIRFLLGLTAPFRGSEDRRPVTRADLERAKAVLRDDMDVVFITERMPASGCLVRRLGWEDKPLDGDGEGAKANTYDPSKHPAVVAHEEDRPEVRALLHELNALDKELYEYGVALHEEQLRACECCEAGAAEVRLF